MTRPDVIIAGAGIIGTMTAWHLAKAGVQVTLVDQADGAARAPAATWASAGGLRRQGRSAADQPLTKRAAARWPGMEQELGADLEVSLGGHLHLTETEAGLSLIKSRVAADRAAGLEIDLIDANTIREIAPHVTQRALAGAWTPGDGQAHPGRVAQAALTAFKALGGETRFGQPIKLNGNSDSITGVTCGTVAMSAPLTIVATGAWSIGLLHSIGLSLPLRWRALTMLLSNEAQHGLLAPTVTAVGRNLSLKQLRSGQFMLGGNWLSEPFKDAIGATPIDTHMSEQWSTGVAVLPHLSTLKMVQAWAGAEAQSPDGNPLIGRCATRGLYLATGFSNHGFQISPAVGEAIAADIATGSNPLLTPFDPHRLDGLDQARLKAFQNAPILAVA